MHVPDCGLHTPFSEQSMSDLQLPTGSSGDGVGGACGGGAGPGAGPSPTHVYRYHPGSAIDPFHVVLYNSAADALRQFALIPNEEQLGCALQAAAASVGHAALLLHANSSFFACSDFGPILSECGE